MPHITRFALPKCDNLAYRDSIDSRVSTHRMTYRDIRYLTPADIYTIAEQVLGREPKIRDRHLLGVAAKRPAQQAFGQDAYPTLIDKAAALMHALAAHHLFFDGNKRTATQATEHFLALNGLCPTWNASAVQQFVLEIAQNQHDVPAVAVWLAEHTEEADT